MSRSSEVGAAELRFSGSDGGAGFGVFSVVAGLSALAWSSAAVLEEVAGLLALPVTAVVAGVRLPVSWTAGVDSCSALFGEGACGCCSSAIVWVVMMSSAVMTVRKVVAAHIYQCAASVRQLSGRSQA